MRDSTGYRLLIPHSWEKIPMAPHGFIVMDRIWQIYHAPPINYNRYFEQPACKRLKEVRQLSKRNVTNINVKRKVRA